MSEVIKRAEYIEIKAGADTKADLICAIEDVLNKLREGTHHSLCGSPSFGYQFYWETDEEMTHDKYMEAINGKS